MHKGFRASFFFCIILFTYSFKVFLFVHSTIYWVLCLQTCCGTSSKNCIVLFCFGTHDRWGNPDVGHAQNKIQYTIKTHCMLRKEMYKHCRTITTIQLRSSRITLNMVPWWILVENISGDLHIFVLFSSLYCIYYYHKVHVNNGCSALVVLN